MILTIFLMIWLQVIRLIHHRYFVLFNCFYVLSCLIPLVCSKIGCFGWGLCPWRPLRVWLCYFHNGHDWLSSVLWKSGVLCLRRLFQFIEDTSRKKNTLHTSQSLDLFSWSLLLGRHSNMLQCARVEGLEATCAAASGDNEVRASEIWNKNILSSSLVHDCIVLLRLVGAEV